MCKISYKDVLYSPAGSCTENNSFFGPVAHNKGVATAWLCLGRGGAHTGGPTSISASGHSLMPGGQALWSRMLTSSLSSCLLAGCESPCFEAWWKRRWELALQLCYSKSVLGPVTLVSPGSVTEMQKPGIYSHPAESGPLSDVYAHYSLKSSGLADNPLGHLLFCFKF